MSDETCFDDYFAAAYPRLVKFLIIEGFGWADAQDVAQEALADLYRHWAEVGHRDAWVRTVARRTAVKLAQRDRDRLRRTVRGGWVTPDSTDPLAAVEERFASDQRMSKLLAVLSDRQREVLAWALDGFSPTEIAHQIGNITPATVRSTLSQARERLKLLLDEPRVTPASTVEGGGSHDLPR